MTSISVHKLQLQYPVIGAQQRSLKNAMLGLASGGRIHKQGNTTVVEALSDISFDLTDGDRLGLIGPNGAGKSTLLKVLAGIYSPTKGAVSCQGRIVSTLNIMMGLEYDATGFENMEIRAHLIGLNASESKAFAQDVEEFCELGEFLHLPVRVYSAGMAVRLAFAMTTAQRAEILLMDEMINAGDAAFMQKATERLDSFLKRARIIALASHSEAIIESFCNKALWLQDGKIVHFGPVQDVLEKYKSLGQRAAP